MRAYSFTNFMLNSVAQGIQPGHCLVDMTRYYIAEKSFAASVMADWADNHKTMINLNGGGYGNILRIWEDVQRLGEALDLPFGCFNEDEETLGGLMTCCSIIVPEKVYGLAAAKWINNNNDYIDLDGNVQPIAAQFSADEKELALLTKSYPLAR